ncbi:MAG: uracil-DNA glycosylase family protein [Acidiphilium sp.]|nr:uracil-DNA glycosylase family protein [Acidiphilium sp.]
MSSNRGPRPTSRYAVLSSRIEALAAEARGCTVCAPVLPLGPRPILRVSDTARLLIISQAPGTLVHASGTPWTDASGDRLRGWLGLEPARFYDVSRVAILPMGLCYPGRLPRGGDCPPRPECAPLWQARLRAAMPAIRLTLLVGSYAQAYHLGPGRLEDRVRNFERFLPDYFPLPHPSWRTLGWAARRPWFEAETLPALRETIATLLEDH